MTEPVRVYVGSVHSHRLMVQVLRWSIQRNTGRDTKVSSIGELLGADLPVPSNPANRPATPFSFQRFAVPKLAGYKGRAIYMDADQLVLRDIAELFDRRMWGLPLLCRPTGGPDGARNRNRSSVMLLDCSKLEWDPSRIASDLDASRYDYHELMSLKFVRFKGRFPRHWNALDHFEPAATGLLHYTRRATQPWVSREHPYAHLWFEALFSGVDAGAIDPRAVEDALEHGYCRPSLRWQFENRERDPGRTPKALHEADAAFFRHCETNRFNNLDGDYRSN